MAGVVAAALTGVAEGVEAAAVAAMVAVAAWEDQEIGRAPTLTAATRTSRGVTSAIAARPPSLRVWEETWTATMDQGSAEGVAAACVAAWAVGASTGEAVAVVSGAAPLVGVDPAEGVAAWTEEAEEVVALTGEGTAWAGGTSLTRGRRTSSGSYIERKSFCT